MGLLLDFILVFILIIISGVFAAAELALASLRDSQITELENEGTKRGLKVAKIARKPDRFLSSSQIGITLISFFSATFGAATMSPYVAPLFVDLGLSETVSDSVTLVVLTIVISYLSLVFGELVPKLLALQKTKKVSLVLAGPLDAFSVAMTPFIWFLSKSTNAVYRLMGGNPNDKSDSEISEDELQTIVEEHGTLNAGEKQILSDVLDAADQTVSEVMQPRGDVDFIKADMKISDAQKYIHDRPYSRFPVIGEDFDDVLGFVHVRDVLDLPKTKAKELTVGEIVREILKFPGTNQLLPCLTAMRAKGIHIAIILDEFGGTDGICTLEDIIEELVGDIQDEYDLKENPEVIAKAVGDFSIDAGISLQDFEDATGITLPDGHYETVGGYVLSELGRVAKIKDCVFIDDVSKLIVTKIDGERVMRVELKIEPKPKTDGEEDKDDETSN
ncbi:MAG: hemolysin family protein [Candidatus Ancillula sp.]|jgi:putative hemolysin|nr:hemolysin family protein [Candidatus Ancillula sp.]